MNMLLLKKIEELTLYTLEQEEEIENLKLRIDNSVASEPMTNGQQLIAKQIEELTLYTISQESEIEQLKVDNEQLGLQLKANSQQLIAKQIEELTLHSIKQNKQISKQEQEIENLKLRIDNSVAPEPMASSQKLKALLVRIEKLEKKRK